MERIFHEGASNFSKMFYEPFRVHKRAIAWDGDCHILFCEKGLYEDICRFLREDEPLAAFQSVGLAGHKDSIDFHFNWNLVRRLFGSRDRGRMHKKVAFETIAGLYEF
jgi:hypothetical protein